MGVSVLRQSGLSGQEIDKAQWLKWWSGHKGQETPLSQSDWWISSYLLYKYCRWGVMKPRKRFLRGQEGVMEDDQFYRGADVVLIIVSPTCFLLFNCAYWYYYCIHCSWKQHFNTVITRLMYGIFYSLMKSHFYKYKQNIENIFSFLNRVKVKDRRFREI